MVGVAGLRASPLFNSLDETGSKNYPYPFRGFPSAWTHELADGVQSSLH
jgi:hypothetical protein